MLRRNVVYARPIYQFSLSLSLFSSLSQPVVVVSELGAGRAGCFSAVAMAHRIMTDPQLTFIDGWSYDQNLLDMVHIIY